MDSCKPLSSGPHRLRVRAWVDPVVEAHGFGPRSPYVEHCYLPVLGPTTTWLYRRLGSLVELQPDGVDVEMVQLSRSLGLGPALGQHSPAWRSLGRLARFYLARCETGDLLVRRAVAPLTLKQLAVLPEAVQRVHAELVGGSGRHGAA